MMKENILLKWINIRKQWMPNRIYLSCNLFSLKIEIWKGFNGLRIFEIIQNNFEIYNEMLVPIVC